MQDLKHCDPRVFYDADGYPNISGDLFQPIHYFDNFNHRHDEGYAPSSNTLAWDICSRFFEETAIAIQRLGARLKVEVLFGGLSEELAKMQFNADLDRPQDFPRQYLRMWLSNVP